MGMWLFFFLGQLIIFLSVSVPGPSFMLKTHVHATKTYDTSVAKVMVCLKCTSKEMSSFQFCPCLNYTLFLLLLTNVPACLPLCQSAASISAARWMWECADW